jgi:general secretion pathway protein I
MQTRRCRLSAPANGQTGFTLIEVLVALLIAGTALIGVSQVVGDYSRNLAGLQERTWASWSAMNQIVEFQLEEAWPAVGNKSGEDKTTLIPFHWKRDVKETPYELVRKVEVSVYMDKFDKEPLTRITTYTGKESTW